MINSENTIEPIAAFFISSAIIPLSTPIKISNLELKEEFPDAVTQEEMLDAKKRNREKT